MLNSLIISRLEPLLHELVSGKHEDKEKEERSEEGRNGERKKRQQTRGRRREA